MVAWRRGLRPSLQCGQAALRSRMSCIAGLFRRSSVPAASAAASLVGRPWLCETGPRCRHRGVSSGAGARQALEDLNVADNALSELPAGLGRLASLKQLTVYGNRLRALAQDLVRLPSLQGARARPARCSLRAATRRMHAAGEITVAPRIWLACLAWCRRTEPEAGGSRRVGTTSGCMLRWQVCASSMRCAGWGAQTGWRYRRAVGGGQPAAVARAAAARSGADGDGRQRRRCAAPPRRRHRAGARAGCARLSAGAGAPTGVAFGAPHWRSCAAAGLHTCAP